MRATIQFSHPDNKLAILSRLVTIIKGIKNLRQHFFVEGILLERLSPGDIENVHKALAGLSYLKVITLDSVVRVLIIDGELRTLFGLVMPVPLRQNDFARIFWERGFTIEKLSRDQAEGLRDQLETIATVTIAPDVPQTRIYTVSGQVVQEDGMPLSASGFTVCAFDSLSANTYVRCGAVVTLQDDAVYRIDYAWRSNGRKGPNLLVRVFDREGEIVAETRKTSAGIQEFLDLTAEGLCIVRGAIRHTEGFPLPHLIVRAFDRGMRAEALLGQAITDAEGIYEITYSTAQLRTKEQADLIIRVFEPDEKGEEGGEEIARTEILFNAPLQQTIDLEVKSRKFQGPSEYERYLATLKPLIDDEPEHELTDEDLTFLNGKTGISFEHLDYLRLDAQWSLQYSLEPGLAYGLFRQGLPPNFRRLLAEKPSRFQEALRASSVHNIISANANQIDQFIVQLVSLTDSVVFELERKVK